MCGCAGVCLREPVYATFSLFCCHHIVLSVPLHLFAFFHPFFSSLFIKTLSPHTTDVATCQLELGTFPLFNLIRHTFTWSWDLCFFLRSNTSNKKGPGWVGCQKYNKIRFELKWWGGKMNTKKSLDCSSHRLRVVFLLKVKPSPSLLEAATGFPYPTVWCCHHPVLVWGCCLQDDFQCGFSATHFVDKMWKGFSSTSLLTPL